MSAEHPNLALIRRAQAAFDTGNVAEMTALFAPDIVLQIPGRSIMAGTFRGQKEVFESMARTMALAGGSLKVTALGIMANEQGGAILDRVTAEREGRKLDVNILSYMVIRGGQVAELYDYIHQEHLWDAFWGLPA